MLQLIVANSFIRPPPQNNKFVIKHKSVNFACIVFLWVIFECA